MDELRNPEVALRYACEFCGAPPGEPCDNPAAPGKPHYSRTPDNHEPSAAERLGWK